VANFYRRAPGAKERNRRVVFGLGSSYITVYSVYNRSELLGLFGRGEASSSSIACLIIPIIAVRLIIGVSILPSTIKVTVELYGRLGKGGGLALP